MEYTIKQTEIFAKWHKEMRDLRAQFAIARRIDRFAIGNFGDVKSVGKGVSEMRVDIGQGYRVYYTLREHTVIFLLCGGGKSTQKFDIKRAMELVEEI